MPVIAEGITLDTLPDAEHLLAEGEHGEVRIYCQIPPTEEQLALMENEIRSQGVVLTAPIISEGTIVSIKFRKMLWPLLIIAAAAAAALGLGWWQLNTTLGGIPFWVWAVGLGALAYLFFKSDTGKKATSVASTAAKIYITRGALK